MAQDNQTQVRDERKSMDTAAAPAMSGTGIRSSWLLGGILVLAAVIGSILAGQLNSSGGKSEEDRWRDRLAIVADSRAREGASWLNRHLGAVEILTRDSSLQLYASEVASGDSEGLADAQRGYVFAILSAEAERSGFHEDRPTDSLAANVNRPQRMGIGVFSTAGDLLVGSPGLPAFESSDLSARTDSFIRLGPLLDDGTPLVLFGAPIYAGAVSLTGITGQTGWVVGARPLDGSFLSTLTQPGDLSETGETYVIQRVDLGGALDSGQESDLDPNHNRVRMLTPLKGGGRRFDIRDDAAAYQAASTPGAFVAATNYQDMAVLATARDYSAPVDWVLVRSIDRAEVSASSDAARLDLLANFGFAGTAILALLILAWRLGSSARLEAALARQEDLTRANEDLSVFLTSIADEQPTAIAVVDGDMDIHFANRRMHALAAPVGIGSQTQKNPQGRDTDTPLIGSRLDRHFDDKTGSLLRAGASGAAVGEHSLMDLRLDIGGHNRTLRTDFLPIAANRPGLSEPALVVMHDISDLEAAHARSQGTLRHLVETLTLVIDARDPWSRDHSTRVVAVSTEIGRDMALDPIQMETLEITGLLVNLGKVFVPQDILIKSGKLTDSELTQVRDAMAQGIALLSDVEFRGPVGPSLAQVRAHYDGSGEPRGLSGGDILITARILAVANAFVAMVTERAHRPTLGFDKAVDVLNDGAGTLYDRSVVAALVQILENKGGRDRWAHFTGSE